MRKYNDFIWETHGIHSGTEQDHVKHGIDDLENIVEMAIDNNHPSITFIIHSPRLTKFRYKSEIETNVKFIRGNKSYINYPKRIENLRRKYSGKINIKYGVELEWLGDGLGVNWNRSKLFQAKDADFVIGSVHFAPEGLPYDGSREEAEELLALRGSLEAYWDGYFNEVIQMIELMGDMIQVIGHIDLPKLNVDIPEALLNFQNSSDPLAHKFRTILEMIADRNLALDVDMAGEMKGVGVYPTIDILKKARQLGINVAVGTDTHHIKHYGVNFNESLEYIHKAGYEQYVSFSKLIPEARTIFDDHDLKVKYTILNKGIELLNQRLSKNKRRALPDFSFGQTYSEFQQIYPRSSSMGQLDAIKFRKAKKSIVLGDLPRKRDKVYENVLHSYHKDQPGVISSIFNALASEGINVETAYLKSNKDGTASAYISLRGHSKNIKEAIQFIKGTDDDTFIEIKLLEKVVLKKESKQNIYLLELDEVDLELQLTKKIIVTKHKDSAGVLLILLSALASKNVNVIDLDLGQKNNQGYCAIAVEGDEKEIKEILKHLGPDYTEASLICFRSF
jgi:HisJ family histidinol phosphate phosphatase